MSAATRDFDLGRELARVSRSGGELQISATDATDRGRRFDDMLHRATQTSGTEALGGFGVLTAPADLIPKLPHVAVTTAAGAQVMDFSGLPFSSVNVSATATWSYLSEAGGVNVAESNFTFGRRSAQQKICIAQISTSKQLLEQSADSVGGAQMLEGLMLQIAAAERDRVLLAGTGTSNQPAGLLFTSGTNVVSLGVNGGSLTYAKLIEALKEVGIDNADFGPVGTITTPEIAAGLRSTERAAGSGFCWGDDNRVLNYPAFTTNAVPKTFAKGTGSNLHGVAIGKWDEIAIVYFGPVRVLVDPFTRAPQDLTVITVVQPIDVLVRRPEAFAVMVDAIAP